MMERFNMKCMSVLLIGALFIVSSSIIAMAVPSPSVIYGHITSHGSGVNGVTITLTGTGRTSTVVTATDLNDNAGYFQFAVTLGDSYVINAVYDGITWSRSVTATSDLIDLGSADLTPPDPIKNARTGLTYTSIQVAIDDVNTTNGDTIRVNSGIYHENVLVDKQLSLYGIDTGSGQPIVDASGAGNGFNLSSEYIIIDGFTVKNATSGAGVLIAANNTVVSNNTIINGAAGIEMVGTFGNKATSTPSHTYSGNLISGNNVSNQSLYGIMFQGGGFNELDNNIVSKCLYGFIFSGSTGNVLKNNQISSNYYNFDDWFGGGTFNYVDTSNTVDGKPIYYIRDQSNLVIDASTNAGVVYLLNCTNSTVRDLSIANTASGIALSYSNGINVVNNTIKNTIIGVFAMHPGTNRYEANSVTDSSYGMLIEANANNVATLNNVHNCTTGIVDMYTSGTQISFNSVDNNSVGIEVLSSNGTLVEGNSACYNKQHAGYFQNGDLGSTGIFVRATNCTIRNNNASYNYEGIVLLSGPLPTDYPGFDTSSSNNIVEGNTLTYNTGLVTPQNASISSGLAIVGYNNSVKNNDIGHNDNGILLVGYSGNGIFFNTIHDNAICGFNISNSGGNWIYRNDIVGNTANVLSDISRNAWDTVKAVTYTYNGTNFTSAMGNHWGDYNGTDSDGNGVGDTSYVNGIVDKRPLMSSFNNYIGGTVETGTYTVGPSGCNYKSIQDAINDSINGDTILVYSGTYYENVNVYKSVMLQGVDNGGGLPVINGGGKTVVQLSAPGVSIENFTVTNSGSGYGIVAGGQCIIKNNIVTDSNWGIWDSGLSNLVVSNTLSNCTCGIIDVGATGSSIINNNASNNQLGIFVIMSNYTTVENNTACFNNKRAPTGNPGDIGGEGFVVLGSTGGVFRNNNFSYNFIGVAMVSEHGGSPDENFVTENNLLADNVVTHNTGITLGGDDISSGLILTAAFNTITGNDFSYNDVGITLTNTPNTAYRYGYNNVSYNTIDYNNKYGLFINSTNNQIFRNDVVANNCSVLSMSFTKAWDYNEQANYHYGPGDYTSYLGNYWSDYTGTDADDNGVGDTSYEKDNIYDAFPLMKPNALYLSGTGSYRTITVGSSGQDFTSIQAAVDAANSGDTIQVYSGTYHECVDVNKTLNILGIDDGNGLPVVDGNGNTEGSIIMLGANGITWQGFTIVGSSSLVGIHVLNFSSWNTISDNTIKSCGSGIYAEGPGNIISWNTIWGSTIYGIYLNGSSKNLIENNVISNITLVPISELASIKQCGMAIWSSKDNKVTNNSISNQWFGILDVGSTGNIFTSNNVSNNYLGIYEIGTKNTLIENNEVCFNNGHPSAWIGGDMPSMGLCLSGSNCTIRYNNFSHNLIGIIIGNIENSGGKDNVVEHNYISHNTGLAEAYPFYSSGISVLGVSNNTIRYNDINNDDYGMIVDHSSGAVYVNDFWSNAISVFENNSTSLWNSPAPMYYQYGNVTYIGYLGNWWSDYAGIDMDGNGVGDSSYVQGRMEDKYPLVQKTAFYTIQGIAEKYTGFTLSLKKGWNLVSSPLVVDPAVNVSVFKGTNVTMVARYNKTTGGFDIYRVGKTPIAFPFEAGQGYFLYCNNDTTYTVNGFSETNQSTTISQGWNLIGWTNMTASNSKTLAQGLHNVTMLARYNTTSGGYDIYRVGKTPTPFAIQAGEGYFLYTTYADPQTLAME